MPVIKADTRTDANVKGADYGASISLILDESDSNRSLRRSATARIWRSSNRRVQWPPWLRSLTRFTLGRRRWGTIRAAGALHLVGTVPQFLRPRLPLLILQHPERQSPSRALRGRRSGGDSRLEPSPTGAGCQLL